MKTLGYRISQKARKKAEQVFGWPLEDPTDRLSLGRRLEPASPG
jgi:hypothetical protein